MVRLMTVIEDNKGLKTEQAPRNFYDILFSSSHLKVSFWKYKTPVKTKVPNGFDLDGMNERELSDVIRSRGIRRRILVEASKLIKDIREKESVSLSLSRS